MKQCRAAARASKQESSELTVWRLRGTTRVCVIPEIVEDDQYIGKRLQAALDQGQTPHQYLREAVALHEAFSAKALQLTDFALVDDQTAAVLLNDLGIIVPDKETVELAPPVEEVVEAFIQIDEEPDNLTKLLACETYAEVRSVMAPLSEEIKSVLRSSLSPEQTQKIYNLKKLHFHKEDMAPKPKKILSQISSQECVGKYVTVMYGVENVRKSLRDIYQCSRGKSGIVTSEPSGNITFVDFGSQKVMVELHWLEVN